MPLTLAPCIILYFFHTCYPFLTHYILVVYYLSSHLQWKLHGGGGGLCFVHYCHSSSQNSTYTKQVLNKDLCNKSKTKDGHHLEVPSWCLGASLRLIF